MAVLRVQEWRDWRRGRAAEYAKELGELPGG